MAEQRNIPLESGGTIRVTEAIMRGSGPQGPKGDRGDTGVGTVIQGAKEFCAEIFNLRGNHEGEGWICEEDGHLYVWHLEKEEAGENPWVDCGKIVGPPGQVQSIGAAWGVKKKQFVRDDYTEEYEVLFDTIHYVDEEILTNADGSISGTVPIVSFPNTTSFSTWGYPNHSWVTTPQLPVHIIDIEVKFQAETTTGGATVRKGPATVKLYKQDGVTLDLEMVAEDINYMDSAQFPFATMNLTWTGKTKADDVFHIAVSSAVPGNIIDVRAQTARCGGGVGPQGPQGEQGIRGETGEIGPVGPAGRGISPAGTIIAFAGGPEDLPGYYERLNGKNWEIDQPLVLDTSSEPIRMLLPDWLPCDGQPVPAGTQLYDHLGFRNTPDLRERSIITGSQLDWEAAGRFARGEDHQNGVQNYWDYRITYGGSDNTPLLEHNHDFAGTHVTDLKADTSHGHATSSNNSAANYLSGADRQDHSHNMDHLHKFIYGRGYHNTDSYITKRDNDSQHVANTLAKGGTYVSYISAKTYVSSTYSGDGVSMEDWNFTGKPDTWGASARHDHHVYVLGSGGTGIVNSATQNSGGTGYVPQGTIADKGTANVTHKHPHVVMVYLIKT